MNYRWATFRAGLLAVSRRDDREDLPPTRFLAALFPDFSCMVGKVGNRLAFESVSPL